MKKYVHEVGDLTYKEAIIMSSLDYDFETMQNSVLIIDFKHMTHFEPFSMLIAAHIFKKWGLLCKENNVIMKIRNYQHCGYAGHMGFFKYFGYDFGKAPNEAKGNGKYLPITVLKVNDLQETSTTRREKVQETIDRKSRHLASILGQGNFELETTLSYAIREIMRNVVEHSQSETVTIAAQRWENIGQVEIAIFDEGVGIRNTLSSNPHINLPNTRTALDYCLQPGISGKAYYVDGVIQNSKGSEWDHSGFGLFVTSELCKMGGEFTIISNDAALHFKDQFPASFDTAINGTGIRLRLNLDEIPDLGEKVIDAIVKNGEKLAAVSNQNAIVSASKMSRIIKR